MPLLFVKLASQSIRVERSFEHDPYAVSDVHRINNWPVAQSSRPKRSKAACKSTLSLTPLCKSSMSKMRAFGAFRSSAITAGTPALDVSLVHAAKQRLHLHQSRVDHQTDGSQRMPCRNEIFQPTQGKQALGEFIGSAHEFQLCSSILDQRLRTGLRGLTGRYFISPLNQFISDLYRERRHSSDVQNRASKIVTNSI